jgi:esterase/lipase
MFKILFPTILLHGFGGSIEDLSNLKSSLQHNGAEVYSIEVGNGALDSILMNINRQCSVLSENIKNLNIDGKINIIGISQGGLLARCYVQKYSHIVNPVHSLITYGSPHMGIYVDWLNLHYLEYWKNPYEYDEYLKTNDFLVYLNNEKNHDNYDLYKNNMLTLDNFAMIWSNIDLVITPLQSAKFEFYNVTEGYLNLPMPLNIVELKKSAAFKRDKIGLKTLNKLNRLYIERYDCRHEDFKSPDCYMNKNYSENGVSLIKFTLGLL